MTIPYIDIRRDRFLTPMFNAYVHETKTEPNVPLDQLVEQLERQVKIQSNQWEMEGEKILKGLTEEIKLSFFESVIPVYVVPSYDGAFSDPIVISSLQTKHFNDVLTHELIHRLGDYNTKHVYIREIAKKLHPEIGDALTRDHIFVHAVHAYIYLDILKDEGRMKFDIDKAEGEGAYHIAWQYVLDAGYDFIIQQYQSQF